MKRLLTISHSYVLAVNRRLAHEMQAVGGNQWQVTAVAPDQFIGASDIRAQTFEAMADESIDVRVVPARWTSRVHIFQYGRALRRIARSGFDLVHAWEEPYVAVGWQIARAVPRRTPLVFRTAQSLNKRYPPPFNWIEQYCVRRMAGCVCSGSLVQAMLHERTGYAQRPSRLIPLGVDLAAFRPDAAAGRAVKRDLGWSDGPPVVGFLGRFVPEKGLKVLMDALDRVPIPWRAMFVGGGPMEDVLRDWGGRFEDGRVRLCTSVKHAEVPAYLNAMDLLVAPSQTTPHWKEQFGRMTVEAFASGVPVIGSDSGEIPFVIGDAGLICAEADVDAWARTIGELLDSPSRRHDLANAGRARAPRYSWSQIAREYLDFFESILDGQARMI